MKDVVLATELALPRRRCRPAATSTAPRSSSSAREHREHQLTKVLAGVRDHYEVTLIDCPPSLGLLSVNALCAADSVLIPLQTEYYALEGLAGAARDDRARARRSESRARDRGHPAHDVRRAQSTLPPGGGRGAPPLRRAGLPHRDPAQRAPLRGAESRQARAALRRGAPSARAPICSSRTSCSHRWSMAPGAPARRRTSMSTPRNALGRGIGALIPTTPRRARATDVARAAAPPVRRSCRSRSIDPESGSAAPRLRGGGARESRGLDPHPRRAPARGRATRGRALRADRRRAALARGAARGPRRDSRRRRRGRRRRSARGRAGRERPAQRPQPDRARDRVPRARRYRCDAGGDRPARRTRSLVDRQPPAPARSRRRRSRATSRAGGSAWVTPRRCCR